jgi:anaerobic magnesium-protoporphyrin IX monomethyl ester cyclase
VRVALVYPPDFTPPTMPFAALPLLDACLTRTGHEPMVMDLNAESFTFMIAEGNLERYFDLLDGYTETLASKSGRTLAEEQVYQTYRRLHLYPRGLMKGARDAMKRLRDPKYFYDPAAFRHAHRVIRTTHSFLTSLTPCLDPRNQNFGVQLYGTLADDSPDPYTDVFASHTLPKLAAFGPGLIAFTCPFSRQVAPAMRLAKRMKEKHPGVKFVIGGTGVSDAQHIILTDPRFYEYIDYAIVGDGEEALPDLIAAIEGKKSFDEVAALWRRDGREVVKPARFHNVDMDLSPAPDYRRVDFTHYCLPEPTAIYTTSRGCYYGKCTFCPESFRVGFRMRSPENVYADMRELVLNQGVRNVHFFDPLTPPRTLAYLSREVAREKLPLNWYAEVKFEKIYTSKQYMKTLSEGGCKILQFGFESGVQRVLDGMKKGNNLAQIEIMLDNLKAHGIGVSVTWFIGFPTESEDDARESWRFLRRHDDEMHLSLYTGTFGLGHDVPVFQHPEDYDIKLTFDALGNPSYQRNDGGDWDQQKQHVGYHVRSDLQTAIGGAALHYAANRPDLLRELRVTSAVGPMSFEEPPIAERVVSVPTENNYLESAPGADGRMRYKVYVAQSAEAFDADETDIALLKKIGHEGRRLSEVIESDGAPADVMERLAAFVDKGFIEMPDPVPASVGTAAPPSA